jgi:hypothetical protein
MPPPSNGAPEDCDKLVKPEQPVFPRMEPTPDNGVAGLMPGAAISVDPSGIPAAGTVRPVPRTSGDVAMPEGDCRPGVIAGALAGFHHTNAAATSRGVHRLNAMARNNPGVAEEAIPVSGSEAGMCNSPDTSHNKR